MFRALSKAITRKIRYNPRKTTIVFAITLLIIIILVQTLLTHIKTKTKTKETFTMGDRQRDYDPHKPLIITDRRPLTFNQNYDKIWLQDAVSSNDSDRVQDISHSAINYNPPKKKVINSGTASHISHILTPTQIKSTLTKIVSEHGLPESVIKSRYGAFHATPYLTYGIGSANSKNKNFTTMNRQTWRTRWREYKPSQARFQDFPIPVSPLENMENMINYFLNVYNNVIHKMGFSEEMTKTYGFDPYYISNYKLNDIHQNDKTNAFIYGVTLIVTQDVSSPISYTIYVQILREISLSTKPIANTSPNTAPPNKYFIIDADLVGNTTSDALLIPPSESKSDTLYSLHKDYNNSANKTVLTPKDVETYLRNSIKNIKGRNLDDQYVCFNTDISDSSIKKGNSILYSSSAEDCTSKYDLFGRPKETGVWDKPCKKDIECPYYASNENYTIKNNLGKCMPNGYCQLPINMRQIGYHYYDRKKKNEPLCYNCNAKKWNAITPLGNCCEEQKNSTKYPFLKSPDYAFKNDLEQRINENRKRNCHNKVDLNTGVSELVCTNT